MPTTPNGTAYTVTSLTDPVAGDIWYGYPNSTPADMPVVLYAHGAGGAANQFATLPAWGSMKNAIIDAGIGWVECTGGGDRSWGSPAAQAAYVAAYEAVAGILNIGPVIILGRSMGGAVAQWLYTQSDIPNMVGLMVNSGVQDLVAYYDAYGVAGNTIGQAQMRSAWGVADTAEFYDVMETENPVNYPASLWAGLNLLQLAGTSDTTVPPVDHAYAIRAVYSGQPAIDDLYTTAGDHSSSNGLYSAVAPMMAFISTVLGEEPPEPEPREYLRTVAHYAVIDGQKYGLMPLA